MSQLDMTASHCKHATCCQCGAVRGTPEHIAECADAMWRRAMNQRAEGYVGRKLTKRHEP